MKNRFAGVRVIQILFLLFFLTSIVIQNVHAQRADDDDQGSEGLSCFCFLYLFISGFVPFVMWIFIVAWVSSDARGRGMKNPGMWPLLTFFLGIIGLIIYLIARPPGSKIRCPKCGKKKLSYIRVCPFCKFDRLQKKEVDPMEISTKRCPNCGSAVSENETFCHSCYGNIY